MIRGNWRLWTFILVLVVVGTGLVLFRSGLFIRDKPVVLNGIVAPPLPTLVPEQVASGEAAYAQFCASCHGANLEGQPNWKVPSADGSLPAPPHDSTGHTWHHPDELLLDITANGGDSKYNSKMPAFKEQLSREQMVAVLEFIKSRWGREEREYQWWMTTVGSQQ